MTLRESSSTLGSSFLLIILVLLVDRCFAVEQTGISDHPDATRLIVLGDSISACMPPFGSYRRYLWRLLMTYPKGNTSTKNTRKYSECITLEGTPNVTTCVDLAKKNRWPVPPQYDAWWGREARTINTKIAPKYARTLDPPLDVALVLAGVNDFKDENNRTVLEVHDTLRSIVKTLSSNTSRGFEGPTRVLLGTVLTQGTQVAGPEWKDSQPKILRLNKLLRSYQGVFPALTEAQGGGPQPALPFTLVDVATPAWNPNKMTFDGVHPLKEGEKHIAAAFFAALVPLVEERSYKCLRIPKPGRVQATPPTANVSPATELRINSLSNATQIPAPPPLPTTPDRNTLLVEIRSDDLQQDQSKAVKKVAWELSVTSVTALGMLLLLCTSFLCEARANKGLLT